MGIYEPPLSDQVNFTVLKPLIRFEERHVDFNTAREAGGKYKGEYDVVSLIRPVEGTTLDLSSLLRISGSSYKSLDTLLRASTKENVDLEASFTYVAANKIHQIFSKDEYVYAAIGKGLAVYDMNTEAVLATLEIPNTLSKTIWGNETTLYLGTSFGLFEIDYVTLHADYNNITLKESTFIENKDINYVHGENNSLLVATTSGLEYFNWSGNPTIKSKTYIENLSKCYLANGVAYYINTTTVSGETIWNLNRKNNLITDWENPTFTYSSGDTFVMGVALNDIYVTKQTTKNKNNTIFCATTSGIYVIDEDNNEKAIYYMR